MSQETTAPTQSARAAISGAAEMKARVLGASLDRLIAALPDVVDQSMREAIPHRYSPDVAAEFTAAMIAELRTRYAELTAVTA